MVKDATIAAAQIEFYAGLVTEMKGSSIPMGPDAVNFSVREPRGVVGRIIPFNHPFMFCAGKSGAPLAAGNTVVMKPPEQAPLSSLRLAELIGDILPPGVFNLVPGGSEAGSALASHKDVAMIALIGSVPTGRAVMKAASDTLKAVMLELGGKNALIAYPDADPDEVADGVIGGMNFTWCGQSCGSTSRAFIHETIYDAVLAKVKTKIAHYKPGIATDPATTMGSIISKTQYERVLGFIDSAKQEGARLLTGGGRPSDPALAKGFFIEPTVFADVQPTMRIAREEIFGPVLAVFKWATRPKCSNRSTPSNTVSPLRSGPTILPPRTAPRPRCKPASSGSTKSPSISSARRSAASSSPASAAKNALRKCSLIRRRRIFT